MLSCISGAFYGKSWHIVNTSCKYQFPLVSRCGTLTYQVYRSCISLCTGDTSFTSGLFTLSQSYPPPSLNQTPSLTFPQSVWIIFQNFQLSIKWKLILVTQECTEALDNVKLQRLLVHLSTTEPPQYMCLFLGLLLFILMGFGCLGFILVLA